MIRIILITIELEILELWPLFSFKDSHIGVIDTGITYILIDLLKTKTRRWLQSRDFMTLSHLPLFSSK